MATDLAQTNLQLYRQLHDRGWPLDDIRTIQHDYEIILPVMAGWARGCGKPILSHLVGTASALADEGLPLRVVRLGLTHAIYQYGLLNLNAPGQVARRRARLKDLLGEELEADIFRYRVTDFKIDDVRGFLDNFDALDSSDRRVLTAYLGNEVDDHLDGSCLLTDKPRKHHPDWLPLCIELCGLLKLPGLAARLEVNREMEERNGWMRGLALNRPGSFDATPPPPEPQPVARRRKPMLNRLRAFVARRLRA